MNGERIPATIITGFLGAGKTTLIRGLVAAAGGRRIAIIVNEFGDVGFDASLLADCDDPACRPDAIVELTNGCICCTVADEFLPTMQALLERDPPPEHIVIETSGLALPQPLVRAFSWPDIKHRVTVDGVVAVVDGEAALDGRLAPDPEASAAQVADDPAIDHDNPVEELFADQVRCADLVIVTKGDLIDVADEQKVDQVIGSAARSGTRIVHNRGKTIGPEVLIGLESGVEGAMAGRESHHELNNEDHDHDDFDSFVTNPESFVSLDALKSGVERAIQVPGVLRIKGYAMVDGKAAPAAVQAVGRRVQAWFSPSDAANGLVVIGHHDIDQQAVINAMAG
jgi:cobalamin biosynthesis protein CobW